MVEELRGISIKNASLDSFMPEAMAVGETYLNIGRVLGFVLLMMIGIFNSFVATMIISGVFVLGLFVYLIFLGIVKNKVYQHQIAHKKMEEKNKMAE